METTTLATKLAAWKVKCPDKQGDIYLFDDSVRVPTFPNDPFSPKWTPSEDLAEWEQAVFKVWSHAEIRRSPHSTKLRLYDCISFVYPKVYQHDGSGLPALLSAVEQVLVAQDA